MEAYKILRIGEEETIKRMMGLSPADFIPDNFLEIFARHKEMLNRVDSSLCPSCISGILIANGWKQPAPNRDEPPVVVPEEVEVVEKTDKEEVFKPEPVVEVAPPRKFIKDGAKVAFQNNGEDLEGIIESHQANDEDAYYTVTVEGREDSFLVHEDDLSEIKESKKRK
jgi:hypothetical protein